MAIPPQKVRNYNFLTFEVSFKAVKGQLAKRQFFYNIFLLDPEAGKKELRKGSLERLSNESTKLKGWITK